MRIAASFAALLLGACAVHTHAPARAPGDATGGYAPPGFDRARACDDWREAVGDDDGARRHVSFPELDAKTSCFVPVDHGPGGARPAPTPPGCGYPSPGMRGAAAARLEDGAARDERIAAGDDVPLPTELGCALPDDVRRAAARSNAATLRALARRLDAPYPYAAIAAFGHGFPDQNESRLLAYRPADACPIVAADEARLFGANFVRASRAAEAYFGGVAPVIIVTGGAVHSRLFEAFLLDYLLACRFGVPKSAILLDPCADHTHTNLRNTGALVVAIGGRTAYVVTDDGLQSDYLEEWTAFDLIGGSIDQRSLRDFGYLVGAFRRASRGMDAGFWYSPYRFWAEPPASLGGFTCVR